jgi:hypothetical protein
VLRRCHASLKRTGSSPTISDRSRPQRQAAVIASDMVASVSRVSREATGTDEQQEPRPRLLLLDESGSLRRADATGRSKRCDSPYSGGRARGAPDDCGVPTVPDWCRVVWNGGALASHARDRLGDLPGGDGAIARHEVPPGPAGSARPLREGRASPAARRLLQSRMPSSFPMRAHLPRTHPVLPAIRATTQVEGKVTLSSSDSRAGVSRGRRHGPVPRRRTISPPLGDGDAPFAALLRAIRGGAASCPMTFALRPQPARA